MKYFFSNWQSRFSNNHQLTVENKPSTKTTHIAGYGCGVTFSSNLIGWKQDYTNTSDKMTFHKPSLSK